MIEDLNFHVTAVWSKHVPSDGSAIANGAPDPLKADCVLGVPGFPTGLLVYNDGAAYAAMEVYTHRTLQAGSSRLQFDYDVTDFGNFYVDGWTHETDSILCVAGKKYNHSAQRLAKTNMIQVSNQTGGWESTGFVAPPLVQGVPLHHSYVYGFDLATGRYAIETITIGDAFFLLPFALQESTAVPTTWADGVIPQLQNSCGPKGGRLRLLYDNMSYRWI